MNLSLTKKEINHQCWFEHAEDWKRSGFTQKIYCEQHRLGLTRASSVAWDFRARRRVSGTIRGELPAVSVAVDKVSSLAFLVDDHAH